MRIYRTAERYYCIELKRDLFGTVVIVRCWGGNDNRRGGIASEPLEPGRLRQINKERLAHGYLRHWPAAND